MTVRIAAIAVGFPDYLKCLGLYHDKPELPFTVGGEAAGVVVDVGRNVPGAAVGDRVIVEPGTSVVGMASEIVVVPAARLLPVPDDMALPEAAALFVAYQTAYIGLFRRAHLVEGETLLVHGAAGGVGSAAIQLGKAIGGKVIAVVSDSQKASVCRELGADIVVDDGVEDFVSVVKQATSGAGADVVFDPVGGQAFDRSRRCVAVEGRLLVVGFASGTIPSLTVNHPLLKNYSVVGFRTRPFRDDPEYRLEVHNRLVDYYCQGLIRPRIEELPFEELPKALERLGARDATGRIVLNVQPTS